MSETATLETPVKAPKAKKTAKKASKPSADGNNWATKTVRWTENKLVLLRAISKLGATSGMGAVSAAKIAKTTNGKLTEEQVRLQLTTRYELIAQAFVKQAEHEDSREFLFYITPKGKSVIK